MTQDLEQGKQSRAIENPGSIADRERAESERAIARRDNVCAQRIVEVFQREAHDNLTLLDRCESPIEQIFMTAAVLCGWRRRIPAPMPHGVHLAKNHAWLISQYPLAASEAHPAMRLDFVFMTTSRDGGIHRLVVELDGHEFHQRTKDQVSRDKKRDRAIVTRGWRVIRFTGSEIWDEPVRYFLEAEAIARSVEKKS